MRPPRRKQRTVTARLRPYRVVLALVVLLLAGAAAFAGMWPGFDPARVEVVGNRRVAEAEILERAAIARNANMWLQSTSAIARRVEAIPFVATASVHRIPPTTMKIAVTERVPFVILQSGDEAAVADHALRVLEGSSGEETLPVFVLQPGVALRAGAFVAQSRALELRDDYDAMVAAGLAPVELRRDRFGGLVATLPGQVRVLFGDDSDLTRKIALVNPILTQVVRDRARVAAIDLRAPNTPVLQYR